MAVDQRVLISEANLRQVGGVSTEDGRFVNTGLLFRSGYLSDLSGDSFNLLQGLELRNMVDLRRLTESQERPHPKLLDCRVHAFSVSEDDNEFAVIANRLGEPGLSQQAPEMIAQYFAGNITHRLDRYRPVFQFVTNPDHYPLLFNCTAGKDRTGFVAAIVLRLLGVEESVVVDDFLLSNEVRRAWIDQKFVEFRDRLAQESGVAPENLDDDVLAPLRVLLLTQASFIEAVFAAVERQWSSWDVFRRDGLGIDDAQFSRFQKSLLV